MSYEIDGKKYYRVTSVISGKECEAIAYNIRHEVSKDIVINAVTLPGTLMHYKNERYLREMKGLGPPEDLVWNDGENKILDLWEKNDQIEERLYMPANEGFEGFLQFIHSLEYASSSGERIPGIDPVFIEKRLHTDDFAGSGMSVAGTVDLIARVWLKGTVNQNYFYECKHHRENDPNCQCGWMWVVTVMDWKYSIKKQASHREQMSAYHYMALKSGVVDIATENGRFPINHENWSILFKQPGHKIGYTIFKYEQDISGFLEACKILKSPKFRSLNHRNFTYGLKGRCMFCAYQNACPDRQTVTESQIVVEEQRYKVDE